MAIDPALLSENQRSGIRIWAQMIRKMDEDRAIRFLTGIVANLITDTAILDGIIKQTKDKALN